MTLWDQCEGERYIAPLQAEPWRVVEAQHVLSARDLVDTVEEHDLLEALLESTKPPIQKQTHYLLFTPFRYPPLKHGSRFGRMHEPALWYGSLDLETAFAEVAYYRRQFFQDCEGELDYIETPLTVFRTFLSTQRGVDLTLPPFDKHIDLISNPVSYDHSQALGTAMRAAKIEAFMFGSARSPSGINMAAFTPDVFIQKKGQYIDQQQSWSCIAKRSNVEFTRLGLLKKERMVYPVDIT